MKLQEIAEKEPIRTTANALGELIQHIYGQGDNQELRALHRFLTEPSPRSWESTKWIVDSVLRRTAQQSPDDATKEKMATWARLKKVTSPTVAAAVYDLSQKHARGTPAQNISLSKRLRDKLKSALGPQGYVGALAEMGEVNDSNVRKLLKRISKSSAGLAQAAKADMPRQKAIKKF